MTLASDLAQEARRVMSGATPLPLSLAEYAKRVYPAFQCPPHLRVIAEKLEAVERGEIKRLMIFAPPRHGKSLLTSTCFPAWYLGRHPDRSIIFASYAQELASDFGRKVRNMVDSPEHASVFPSCRLSRDSSATQRFDTTSGGSYFAVGRGGSITGRGAHLLLIDDPLKDRAEADSATVRKALQSWHADVAYTRLQPPVGAEIIINTRWHQEDLSGYLLKEHAQEGWDVVSLPAIAEEDGPFRAKGEALWPERFPVEQLHSIRRLVGSASFASLYQQRPSAAEGAIFKRAWWQRYATAPALTEFVRIIQVWDTAFKVGTQNDPSACTTWGETAGGVIYLLHAWAERVEFPQLCRKAVEFAGAWKPHAVLVEDKASGQSLIQTLKQETSLPVLAIKVEADKVSRANAVTPMIEAGNVRIPAHVAGSWQDAYVEELSAFPNAAHDDQADTTSMALEYFRTTAAVTLTLVKSQRRAISVF